jgi:hypothetical protein
VAGARQVLAWLTAHDLAGGPHTIAKDVAVPRCYSLMVLPTPPAIARLITKLATAASWIPNPARSATVIWSRSSRPFYLPEASSPSLLAARFRVRVPVPEPVFEFIAAA